jgi:hypothetical protein
VTRRPRRNDRDVQRARRSDNYNLSRANAYEGPAPVWSSLQLKSRGELRYERQYRGAPHCGKPAKYIHSAISNEVNGLCVHSMRATAATNALSNEVDIAMVQRRVFIQF